jgi:Glycosyl hydrolases family 31
MSVHLYSQLSTYPLIPQNAADVGGFFGNPGPEMLVRWYHIGAFSPFFRAHAHIDTKRREPFLLDEPYKSIVRDTIKLRYSMLPIWYTAFRESSVTGMPVVRFATFRSYSIGKTSNSIFLKDQISLFFPEMKLDFRLMINSSLVVPDC